MAAKLAGIDAEGVPTDTIAAPASLIDNNPLGKIPTLVTDEGQAVYDSRAIMQFLDRTGAKRLYPRNAAKRTEVEVLEALCDGICDCLLAIMYERAASVRGKGCNPSEWIRQASEPKVERGLDPSGSPNCRAAGEALNGGPSGARSTDQATALRLPGKWDRGRPKLRAMEREHSRRDPGSETLRPQWTAKGPRKP